MLFYREKYAKYRRRVSNKVSFPTSAERCLAFKNINVDLLLSKPSCVVATPHLTAAPAVKKELLMRLNDADNATCLDLAHTDHYTFETSSRVWFPQPQHNCWLPGLVIKACLLNKSKTPVTIRITGHRLVCSESHFRVMVKQHALPDCVVAGKYDLCKLSGHAESDPVGLTTCAATCVCEGDDCSHVTIQIPRKHEDWEICEISIE